MNHFKSKLLIDEKINSEIEFGINYALSAEDIWNWTSYAGYIRSLKRANRIINQGKISSCDNVLELGCGTGIFTKHVYDKTRCKLVAVDISPELLNIASKKIPIGVEFRVCNANRLDFGLMKFNVVFGSSILHHLNIEEALASVYDVLENNGRVIFVEPNILNPQIFLQKKIPFIKKYLKDLEHETAINRFQLTKVLRKMKFKNVVTIPHDFLHPNTPMKLIRFTNYLSNLIECVPLVREIAGSVLIYAEKKECI